MMPSGWSSTKCLHLPGTEVTITKHVYETDKQERAIEALDAIVCQCTSMRLNCCSPDFMFGYLWVSKATQALVERRQAIESGVNVVSLQMSLVSFVRV